MEVSGAIGTSANTTNLLWKAKESQDCGCNSIHDIVVYHSGNFHILLDRVGTRLDQSEL